MSIPLLEASTLTGVVFNFSWYSCSSRSETRYDILARCDSSDWLGQCKCCSVRHVATVYSATDRACACSQFSCVLIFCSDGLFNKCQQGASVIRRRPPREWKHVSDFRGLRGLVATTLQHHVSDGNSTARVSWTHPRALDVRRGRLCSTSRWARVACRFTLLI